MTTATAILIDTILIDATDEDGQPESFEININLTEDGYVLEVLQDGDYIDGDTFETRSEALDASSDREAQIRKDDRTRERDRIRDQRQYRKDALLGTAEEFDGFDRKAVELLARLIGAGKGEAALAYLRDVK